MGRVLQDELSNGGESQLFCRLSQSDSQVVEIEAAQWNFSLRADLRFAFPAEPRRNIEDKGLHFYLTKNPYRLPESNFDSA